MGLKRDLGVFEITLYGIGMILGAGIYALIGKVTGLAGNGAWLSFLLSSFLAIFTGLSYAELSSIFTKDSAEFDYVRYATKSKYLSYIVAWFMLASMIISGTVVALGFGGYLSAILDMANAVIFAALSIFIFTLINFVGIKISAKINNVATILEVLGLVLIIFGTIVVVGLNPNYAKVKVDYFDFSLSGVISGTILAFFAYIGFGSIVKMGEEVKNPEKTLPKAILLSIFITTLLYIGVAIASITIASPQELYTSSEPAALIAEKIHPNLKLILSVIALFSTGNTILLTLISSSRMLYGLASQKVFPSIFSKINKFTYTPHYSVLITGIISAILLIYSDIKIITEVSNLWIFICYFFVNISVILLRYKKLEKERSFKIPLNIGRFPLLSFFGALTSLWMIFEIIKDRMFLEDPVIYLTLLVLCIATIFYLFGRFKKFIK